MKVSELSFVSFFIASDYINNSLDILQIRFGLLSDMIHFLLWAPLLWKTHKNPSKILFKGRLNYADNLLKMILN
jgi:hypothetical protein